MRKAPTLTRAELGVLHRLLEEPNSEGQLDGLKWTRFPGLFILIRGNGRSWVFRWNVQGRKQVMGLGSCSKVTPQYAVDLAAKYMAIVHEGGNPIEVRDAERAAAGLKPVRPLAAAADPVARTFRDAARVYMAKHEDGWTDPLQWARPLQRYAYPLMANVPISQVSTDHLVKVLEPIWMTKHVTAMKLKSRIAQVLDWAEAERLRSGDNPARAKSVSIRLGNGFRKPVQHFKAIHYPQMPTFWKALAAVDSVSADVVRFMVLTATRPSEALNARWEEIDLAQRIWTIPLVRMKMKKPHRIPLSDKAIEVLQRRTADGTTGLIFIGSLDRAPINRTVPRTLIRRLGYDATAHGCRSSFADWCREVARADRELRELSLSHWERNEAVAAYSRSDLLESRRPLMQAWADYLTA